jgi:hypothetical protein
MENQSHETAAAPSLVLSFAVPTDGKDEKGNVIYGKYTKIGELEAVTTSGRSYLTTKDIEGNTYYVNSVKEAGPKSPKKVLSVLRNGAEESELLSGLFERPYSDGTKSLKGKSRDNGIKYAIFINNPSSSVKRAPATAADL